MPAKSGVSGGADGRRCRAVCLPARRCLTAAPGVLTEAVGGAASAHGTRPIYRGTPDGMTTPRDFFRTPARLSLLLAAVLHLAGAAIGPGAHAGAVRGEAPTASAEQPRDERRPQPPAPHDERSCVLCHAFTGAALPTTQPTVSFTAVPIPELAPESSQVNAAVLTSSTRARAPPLA